MLTIGVVPSRLGVLGLLQRSKDELGGLAEDDFVVVLVDHHLSAADLHDGLVETQVVVGRDLEQTV